MEEMIKHEEYSSLFDCYGSLLTEKQQMYFKMYYFEDYSLGEIATEFSLSRNAVYDTIQKTIKVLEKYEQALHMMENMQKRNAIIAELEKKYPDELFEKLKNID